MMDEEELAGSARGVCSCACVAGYEVAGGAFGHWHLTVHST